uniref:Uncharacterized protein n=1 Tax=Cacopsylla melanoneura TaxID=428564 RepID=A0A8D8T8B9_9HEMI
MVLEIRGVVYELYVHPVYWSVIVVRFFLYYHYYIDDKILNIFLRRYRHITITTWRNMFLSQTIYNIRYILQLHGKSTTMGLIVGIHTYYIITCNMVRVHDGTHSCFFFFFF